MNRHLLFKLFLTCKIIDVFKFIAVIKYQSSTAVIDEGRIVDVKEEVSEEAKIAVTFPSALTTKSPQANLNLFLFFSIISL